MPVIDFKALLHPTQSLHILATPPANHALRDLDHLHFDTVIVGKTHDSSAFDVHSCGRKQL